MGVVVHFARHNNHYLAGRDDDNVLPTVSHRKIVAVLFTPWLILINAIRPPMARVMSYIVRKKQRCGRFLNPTLRNDWLIIPHPFVQIQIPNFRKVTYSQATTASTIVHTWRVFITPILLNL